MKRAALALLLALPVVLLHSRSAGDAVIDAIDLLWLAGQCWRRDTAWLGWRWVQATLLWWGWLVLCSLPGIGGGGMSSLAQALAVIRLPLLALAMQHWLLPAAPARRWFFRVLLGSAVYVAAQSLLQLLTGFNLFGFPRGPARELTGPFARPIGALVLSRLWFPAFLPGLAARNLAALLAGLFCLGMLVLSGQRMPLLLTGLGLVIAGLLSRRLRLPLLTALGLALLLIGGSALLNHAAYQRLVPGFAAQLENISQDRYGQIYRRDLVLIGQHLLHGSGAEGFRHRCTDPATFHGWAWPENPADTGGGAEPCRSQHAHNFYLEAAIDGGLPGLALFCLMAATWLAALGRGLARATPLRLGLFTACAIHLWPIAAANVFGVLPPAGFFFLLLGLGLAEADADTAPVCPPRAAPYMGSSPAALS